VAPLVSAVLATLWMFRDTLLRRNLPGDIGDARWSTALTEHWYQVWTGHEAIRDLPYFFPQRRTLGTSEPFFFQGQVHALARAFGFGLLDAWFIAQVATFLVGALGIAVLSTMVLRTTWSRIAFVGTSCLSYPMLEQSGHVQSYAYLWVAWLFVGLWQIHAAETARGRRSGILLLLVVPPTLAITSYYALIFGAVLMGTLGVFLIVVNDRQTVAATSRRAAHRAWLALHTPVGVTAGVVGALLWMFGAWIYLPARNILPAPTWDGVAPYSPQWSD